MKKIFLIIAAVMVGIYSYGQLGLGIKGAVTMNSLSTDLNDYEQAAKVGFQGGAFVRIGDKWHVQPEAYFAVKSGEGDFKVDPGDPNAPTINYNQTMTLNTVDVPVLIGYKIIDPPTMNLRVHAGPVASFALNRDFEFTANGDKVDEDNEPFTEDDFKDMTWGLQAGAGVDFLFLTVDVRYELGLSNLYDKPEGSDIDADFKNNVFFVSVGWKFL